MSQSNPSFGMIVRMRMLEQADAIRRRGIDPTSRDGQAMLERMMQNVVLDVRREVYQDTLSQLNGMGVKGVARRMNPDGTPYSAIPHVASADSAGPATSGNPKATGIEFTPDSVFDGEWSVDLDSPEHEFAMLRMNQYVNDQPAVGWAEYQKNRPSRAGAMYNGIRSRRHQMFEGAMGSVFGYLDRGPGVRIVGDGEPVDPTRWTRRAMTDADLVPRALGGNSSMTKEERDSLYAEMRANPSRQYYALEPTTLTIDDSKEMSRIAGAAFGRELETFTTLGLTSGTAQRLTGDPGMPRFGVEERYGRAQGGALVKTAEMTGSALGIIPYTIPAMLARSPQMALGLTTPFYAMGHDEAYRRRMGIYRSQAMEALRNGDPMPIPPSQVALETQANVAGGIEMGSEYVGLLGQLMLVRALGRGASVKSMVRSREFVGSTIDEIKSSLMRQRGLAGKAKFVGGATVGSGLIEGAEELVPAAGKEATDPIFIPEGYENDFWSPQTAEEYGVGFIAGFLTGGGQAALGSESRARRARTKQLEGIVRRGGASFVAGMLRQTAGESAASRLSANASAARGPTMALHHVEEIGSGDRNAMFVSPEDEAATLTEDVRTRMRQVGITDKPIGTVGGMNVYVAEANAERALEVANQGDVSWMTGNPEMLAPGQSPVGAFLVRDGSGMIVEVVPYGSGKGTEENMAVLQHHATRFGGTVESIAGERFGEIEGELSSQVDADAASRSLPRPSKVARAGNAMRGIEALRIDVARDAAGSKNTSFDPSQDPERSANHAQEPFRSPYLSTKETDGARNGDVEVDVILEPVPESRLTRGERAISMMTGGRPTILDGRVRFTIGKDGAKRVIEKPLAQQGAYSAQTSPDGVFLIRDNGSAFTMRNAVAVAMHELRHLLSNRSRSGAEYVGKMMMLDPVFAIRGGIDYMRGLDARSDAPRWIGATDQEIVADLAGMWAAATGTLSDPAASEEAKAKAREDMSQVQRFAEETAAQATEENVGITTALAAQWEAIGRDSSERSVRRFASWLANVLVKTGMMGRESKQLVYEIAQRMQGVRDQDLKIHSDYSKEIERRYRDAIEEYEAKRAASVTEVEQAQQQAQPAEGQPSQTQRPPMAGEPGFVGPMRPASVSVREKTPPIQQSVPDTPTASGMTPMQQQGPSASMRQPGMEVQQMGAGRDDEETIRSTAEALASVASLPPQERASALASVVSSLVGIIPTLASLTATTTGIGARTRGVSEAPTAMRPSPAALAERSAVPESTGIPSPTMAETSARVAPVSQTLASMRRRPETVPPMFSALGRQIAETPSESLPAKAWKQRVASLVNKGLVKPAEIEWSGINEYLDMMGDSRVPKSLVQNWVDTNGVKVEVYGKGHSPDRLLELLDEAEELISLHKDLTPRQNNYFGELDSVRTSLTEQTARISISEPEFQALLLAVREIESGTGRKDFALSSQLEKEFEMLDAQIPKYKAFSLGGRNYREVKIAIPSFRIPDVGADVDMIESMDSGFTGPHWDERNVVAHYRTDNLVGLPSDPKARVLRVQEIQSDWAQTGRQLGFMTPRTPEMQEAENKTDSEMRERLSLLVERRESAARTLIEVQKAIDARLGIVNTRLGLLTPRKRFDAFVSYAPWYDALVSAELGAEPVPVQSRRAIDGTAEVDMLPVPLGANLLAIAAYEGNFEETPEIKAIADEQLAELTPDERAAFDEYVELVREGFRQTAAINTRIGRGVIPGPFVQSTDAWTTLALKQILIDAVEMGVDAIAIANPDQINAMVRNRPGTEAAIGTKNYYDVIVSKNLRSLMSRLGGEQPRVEEVKGKPNTVVPITDALRQRVTSGLPLFSMRDRDAAYRRAVEGGDLEEAGRLAEEARQSAASMGSQRARSELERLSRREFPFRAQFLDETIEVLGKVPAPPRGSSSVPPEVGPESYMQLRARFPDGRTAIVLADQVMENGRPLVTSNARFRPRMEYTAERPFGRRLPTEPIVRNESGEVVPLSERFPIDASFSLRRAVNASVLENAQKLARSQRWKKQRDFKLALQERILEQANRENVDLSATTKESISYLVRIGTGDALRALRQNKNAVGWYDVKTRVALGIMSLVHPEIATDENARFAFTFALAVTSNGMEVVENFKLANRAYKEYKKTGRMPTNIGAGTSAGAMNKSMENFNRLSIEWGMDDFRRFMMTEFTVEEIARIDPDLRPSDENPDTTVRGAAIIGPKIGNGFFSNLYGRFDALTMDRWLVRTWGRWTGNLVELDPVRISEARSRVQAAIDRLSPGQRGLAEELIGRKLSTDEAFLNFASSKFGRDKDVREKLQSAPRLDELRRAINRASAITDGQKESPDDGYERNRIRAVFSGILMELRKNPEYSNLTMADLQAVLWYAEKRLYDATGATDNKKTGYEDDEAPDYANAARLVASESGVPEAAIKNEEDPDGRSGKARRRNGKAVVRKAVGKFREAEVLAPKQRKQFAGAVIARVAFRKRTEGNTQYGYGYQRLSAKDPGRSRVLTNAGPVTVVGTWNPKRMTRAAYEAHGFATPTFLQLEQDAANGAAFASAITAAKTAQGTVGAAVYVYPAADYADMRLFLSEDGMSGFAIKPDGDVVSVFNNPSDGVSRGRAVMETAVDAGGRKLDCFDTILPSFYADHGFAPVSRLRWDDTQAPAGWSKSPSAFGKYNGGEPDVVFMVKRRSQMTPGEVGKYYDDYGKAVDAQTAEVNREFGVAAPAAPPSPASASSTAEPKPNEPQPAAFSMRRGAAGIQDEATLRYIDRFDELRRYQDTVLATSGSLPPLSNPYRGARLLQGYLAARQRTAERRYADILRRQHEAGIRLEEMDEFLLAQHARERNDYIASINPAMPDGGSGMTNADADAVISRHRAAGTFAAMNGFANEWRSMLRQALDDRLAAGLVNRDSYNALNSRYKRYVPLRGRPAEPFDEDFEEFGDAFGRGLSTGGRGLPAALGRRSMAEGVTSQVAFVHEDTLRRIARNQIGQEFLNLVLAVGDVGMAQVIRPTRRALVNGRVRTIHDMGWMQDERNFGLFVDMPMNVGGHAYEPGDLVVIRINNRRLATAMTQPQVELRSFERGLRNVNNAWRFMTTGMGNPAFAPVNLIRDVLTASIGTAAQRGIADMAGMLSRWPGAFANVFRDAYFDSAPTDEYADFVNAGGDQLYWRENDLESKRTDFDALVRRVERRDPNDRTLARTLFGWYPAFFRAAETASRLATYSQRIATGASPEDAALAARDVTVDFAKGGMAKPVLNTWYMFLNAGLQGNVNVFRSARQALAMAPSLVMLGFANGFLARMMAGDDDETGQSRFDNIPSYEKSSNLYFFDPTGSGRYVKVPMPYGYNVFVSMGVRMADAVFGRDTAGDVMSGMLADSLSAFNPIGGSGIKGGVGNVLVSVLPTAVRPIGELAINEDFSGRPIYPESYSRNPEPDSQMAFDSTPAPYVATAEWLNEVFGGDEFESSGPLTDVSPNTLQYLVGYYLSGTGRLMDRTYRVAFGQDPVELKDVPLARSFVGDASKDTRALSEQYYSIASESAADMRRMREIERGDEQGRVERAAAGIDEAQVEVGEMLESLDKDVRELRKALQTATPEQRRNIIDARNRIMKEAVRLKNSLTDRGMPLR